MKYQLLNAEEKSEANPDTFRIPSLEDRKAIKIGQWAKLVFEGNEITERMWVLVTKVKENLVGILDNKPALLPMSRCDVIEFEHKHIVAILDEADLCRAAGSIRE